MQNLALDVYRKALNDGKHIREDTKNANIYKKLLNDMLEKEYPPGLSTRLSTRLLELGEHVDAINAIEHCATTAAARAQSASEEMRVMSASLTNLNLSEIYGKVGPMRELLQTVITEFEVVNKCLEDQDIGKHIRAITSLKVAIGRIMGEPFTTALNRQYSTKLLTERFPSS